MTAWVKEFGSGVQGLVIVTGIDRRSRLKSSRSGCSGLAVTWEFGCLMPGGRPRFRFGDGASGGVGEVGVAGPESAGVGETACLRGTLARLWELEGASWGNGVEGLAGGGCGAPDGLRSVASSSVNVARSCSIRRVRRSIPLRSSSMYWRRCSSLRVTIRP